MSYINGASDSASANVHMMESDKFGPDLLQIVASTDISQTDELLLDYGDMFQLPPSATNNALGVGVPTSKKARVKTSGREQPPPIPKAPQALSRVKRVTDGLVKKVTKRKAGNESDGKKKKNKNE